MVDTPAWHGLVLTGGIDALSQFVYFQLIYHYIAHALDTFGIHLMQSFMQWVGAIALSVVTLWVLWQGYRMVTGQARQPSMVLVADMLRLVLAVSVASTASIFGTSLEDFLSLDLGQAINALVTGHDETLPASIDRLLAYAQLAMSAIESIMVPPDALDVLSAKETAEGFATYGVAGAPMVAAALLVMFRAALALEIGLGPLFILCLATRRSASLFRQWLLFTLGTLFSMAVLSFTAALALGLLERVAAAFWTAEAFNSLLGQHSEGISAMALQQGGIGLLMTALVISAPVMAARLFGGTLGHFMAFSAFGGHAAHPGHAMRQAAPAASAGDAPLSPPVPHCHGVALPQADAIKHGRAAPSDAELAAAARGDPAYWTAQVGPAAAGTVMPHQPDTAQAQPVVPATRDASGQLTPEAMQLRDQWWQSQLMIEHGLRSADPATQAAARAYQRDLHAQQMARLDSAVYDPDGPAPLGWQAIGNDAQALVDYGLTPNDFSIKGHHFAAQMYRPDPGVFDDTMKTTLAFRGTDIKNLDDIVNDFNQAMDRYSPYYEQAVHMGKAIQRSGKAGSLDTTGHSLGGGLAAAAAVASGASATLFNSAGLHPHTVTRYGGSPHQSVIDAYHVDGEVLTHLQDNPHWLGDPIGAALASTLPKAAGTSIDLPASSFDRIRRHMMHDVQQGIDQSVEQDRATLERALRGTP